VTNVRTGLTTYAYKLDTGPWSAYREGRRITCIKCPLGWSRRSILDMTLSVAKVIRHNGLETVRVERVRSVRWAPSHPNADSQLRWHR
jgi:hypothetical protein